MYMSHQHRVTASSDIEGCGTGWVQGGVWGLGGYGEGYTGYYPATWKAEAQTAERAPGSPAGAGVGWSELQRPPYPRTHPGKPGPGRCAPWCSSGLPGHGYPPPGQ